MAATLPFHLQSVQLPDLWSSVAPMDGISTSPFFLVSTRAQLRSLRDYPRPVCVELFLRRPPFFSCCSVPLSIVFVHVRVVYVRWQSKLSAHFREFNSCSLQSTRTSFVILRFLEQEMRLRSRVSAVDFSTQRECRCFLPSAS